MTLIPMHAVKLLRNALHGIIHPGVMNLNGEQIVVIVADNLL